MLQRRLAAVFAGFIAVGIHCGIAHAQSFQAAQPSQPDGQQPQDPLARLINGSSDEQKAMRQLINGPGAQAGSGPSAPAANPVSVPQGPAAQPAKVDPMSLLIDGGIYAMDNPSACGLHVLDLDLAHRTAILETMALPSKNSDSAPAASEACRGTAVATCPGGGATNCRMDNSGYLSILPNGSFSIWSASNSAKLVKYAYTHQMDLHGIVQDQHTTLTYLDQQLSSGAAADVCADLMPKAEKRGLLACGRSFKTCAVAKEETLDQQDNFTTGNGYCRVKISLTGENGL